MATARIDIEIVDRKDASRRLAQITQAEQKLDAQFKKGSITSEQLRKSTERLARAKALLTRNLNTNSASLRRGTRAAATMTTTLGSLRSVAAAVGVTFGAWQVTRILRSAASAAIDFEAELANVSTLLNTETPEGVKQLKILEQQILALDSRLGGATDLTRGLYQALSAGAKPAVAVRLVGEAALFAKAGLTDTFTAVDVLTTVLNSYQDAAGTAAQASSTLFTIIKEGKTVGTELARSLGQVIPPAAQLGVLLPDLGAALAVATKGGRPLSIVVSGMIQLFKAFQKPTAAAQKILKGIGLSADELRAILVERGLLDALKLLKERTGAANLRLGDFFESIEALNLVLTLTGAGADDFAASLVKLKRAQEEGTATMVAAEKQFATTKNKVAELVAELEKLKIAFKFQEDVGIFATLLTKAAGVATNFFNELNKARERVEFGGLLAAAFPEDDVRQLAVRTEAFIKRLGTIEEAAQETKKEVDKLAGGVRGLSFAFSEVKFSKIAEEATRALAQLKQARLDQSIKELNDQLFLVPGNLKDMEAGARAAMDALQQLPRAAPPIIDSTEQMRDAFRRLSFEIDSFFTQTFLGARSLGDVWNSLTQQMLRVFISTIAKMVAAWSLGMKQIQAASAGRSLGGGGIGAILSGVFGGFGSSTAPGGTGTFSGAPIGSSLVSGGGGLASFAGFGVPGIGVPTGLPPAPAGSASGIAAQSGILGALGLNPLALLASAGIAGGLLGRGGNLLLGGLGGFGLGLGATVGIGALLGAPLGIGLAAGVIPGLVIGAIGLITAIFSRGKNKRKAAASEEVLTQQLGEVINEFKTFQTDLEGALASIDQLFEAFQGQVGPLGKAGRNAVRNISPLVFAVKSRLTEIQAARDARLLLSASSLIPEFHTGGLVPSLLEPGEFVIRREAVQQVGVQNLERVNAGQAPMGNVTIYNTVYALPGMDERAVADFTIRRLERKLRHRGLSLGS
jgi:TP901 family phage tail tape measure protein